MALFLEITVVVLVVGLLAATALAMAVGLVGGLPVKSSSAAGNAIATA